MTLKVHVIYGIFGGHRMAHKLNHALVEGGYTLSPTVADADIIIAHSGGCFWLPEPSDTQKYLLIGPPYWPGRTVIDRIRSRARSNVQPWKHDYALSQWLKRNLWGVYYALFEFKRNYRIIRHVSSYDLSAVLTNRNAMLVRNRNDSLITPDLMHLEKLHQKLRIVTVPGDHGDIIYHPERYVALLDVL